MNIFGKSFTFNDISSETQGLVLCSMDTISESRETALGLELLKSELTPFRDTTNYYTSRYREVLTFDAGIIKTDGSPFTAAERRALINWLTGPAGFVPFTITDYDDNDYHENLVYFVKCTGLREFVPGMRLHGLTFTFECNAPYAFSPEEVHTFDTTGTTSLTIDNTSDELSRDEYPMLYLHAKATGTIIIANNRFPNESMELKVKNGQDLTIDNRLGDIREQLGLFNYATDTNLKWLRLAPGSNTLTITGAASGQIRCRWIRKAGI